MNQPLLESILIILLVGYAISATYIGAGATIVSIGASSVTSSNNFTVNSALGIGTNITLGVGTNTIIIDGDYTTANIVGAGLSNGNLDANTVITGVTTNTITFTPVSLNVAPEVGNTIYIVNNGTFTFFDSIGGDLIADGGGLLLYGSSTRSLTWDRVTNAWESSVNFNVLSGYSYKANGVNVLDENTLRIPNANITGIATVNNLNVTGIENSSKSEYHQRYCHWNDNRCCHNNHTECNYCFSRNYIECKCQWNCNTTKYNCTRFRNTCRCCNC